jgi:hypothetical protein
MKKYLPPFLHHFWLMTLKKPRLAHSSNRSISSGLISAGVHPLSVV